ncbi:MAG: sigma-54 dependent transcriptional regulator [Acidobacteriota bacterium]
MHPEIITANSKMQEILRIAEKAAASTTTILITGESGTGKNLLAGYIHYRSDRSSKPFAEIACANIPADLIESELFGYEKGAFTGATQTKPGRFEFADGGTVLIDEIAELPLGLQGKLLRFLQDRSFERLGGSRTIKVDVRIIATTNANLPSLIERNLFREDLYYRINVLTLHVPPLRERREDISLLCSYFLKQAREKNNKPDLKLSQEAKRILELYYWPGNIREFRNIIENAALLCDGNRIDADDLHDFPIDFSMSDPENLKRLAKNKLNLEEIEKLYIQEILRLTDGNKTKAARILGINRKTLLEKRKKYNLLEPDP